MFELSRTWWHKLLVSKHDLTELCKGLPRLESEGAAHLRTCAARWAKAPYVLAWSTLHGLRRDPTSLFLNTAPLQLAGRIGADQMCHVLHSAFHARVWLLLASHSAWLGEAALRDPALLNHIMHEMSARGASFQQDEDETPEHDPLCAMRRRKMCSLTHAFWREAVLGVSVEETTQSISEAACVLLQSAYDHTCARTPFATTWPTTSTGKRVSFSIIALGKLGGEELNFGSDVDLVFVYETDDATLPKESQYASVHTFFTAFSRALSATIDDKTPARLWRLDLRLRPDGARGPLAMAHSATLRWYEAWGRTFERAVWLKGQAVAGDIALGEALIRDLKPFVFRRHLDEGALHELLEMKGRIERHASRTTFTWASRLRNQEDSPLARWDIKTGRGGIRDIEFTAQALQLVYGGQRPELRSPTTLHALRRLHAAGFLPDQDAHTLTSAYYMYRKIEHLVQMHAGKHIHSLPSDTLGLQRVASQLGETLDTFAERITAFQTRVYTIFQRLLGQETHRDQDPVYSAARSLLDLEDLHTSQPSTCAALDTLGLSHHDAALRSLRALRTHPLSPFRAHSSHGKDACALLVAIARSADPNLGLLHLQRLLTHPSFQATHLRALTSSGHLVTLTANLLGSSRLFSTLLIRHPTHLKALLGPPSLHAPWSMESIRESLDMLLVPARGNPQESLETLRYFKHRHTLRIALAYIAGLISLPKACARLSDLADCVVQKVARIVYEELCSRHGAPPSSSTSPTGSFTVLALGKWGSRELGFTSDLDLVFLYTDEGPTSGPTPIASALFFARLARRFINALSLSLRNGRLYEVDTRLRPNGNQGALVVTYDAFLTYHASARSTLWERLALLRARPISGDESLCHRLRGLLDVLRVHSPRRDVPETLQSAPLWTPERTEERTPHHTVSSVRTLFQNIHQTHNPKQGTSLKFARGGLLHIELFTQSLLWVFAPHIPSLRDLVRQSTGNTLDTLREVQRSGILTEHHCADVCTMYLRLRALEQTLSHTQGRATHALPLHSPVLMHHLARASFLEVSPTPEMITSTILATLARSASRMDALFSTLAMLPDLTPVSLSTHIPLHIDNTP